MRTPRLVREVCRQALRRCQPWTFTNQQHCNVRREQLSDFIQDAHSAMPNRKWLPDRPTFKPSSLEQQSQQPRNLGSNSRDGKTITDYNLKIVSFGTEPGYFRSGRAAKAPPQIRSQEIFILGPRHGVRFEDLPSAHKIRAEAGLHIQFSPNSIPRGRVRLAQFQLSLSAVASASAASQQTRRRTRPDPAHEVGRFRRELQFIPFDGHSSQPFE